jgi:hypothetical protein
VEAAKAASTTFLPKKNTLLSERVKEYKVAKGIRRLRRDWVIR